ncbi:MAG: Gfo/Idh/MocA family oxidoreductase [Pseudomonadota bacterium]
MERIRAFDRAAVFKYLTEDDRYLTRGEAPALRFAFIGCGIMGQEHMFNTLLEGRATVAGIYDPESTSVEAARKRLLAMGVEPEVYASLDAALAADVDGYFIATPNFTHLEVARSVFTAGKPVFLEKPLATELADAAELCRLAAGHAAHVQIGLQYRYKAIYREAINEVFDRDAVGDVQSVNMVEQRFPFLDKVGQWNKFDRYTGGVLVEKCCHYFDLMNLFAGGRAQRVFAMGKQAVNFRNFSYANARADGLDSANVLIEYDNGVMGNFSFSMHVPGSYEELVVCGNSGRLQATEQSRLGEDNRNTLMLWTGEDAVDKISHPSYPEYIAKAGHHGSTFQEHVLFVDAVLNKQPVTPSLDEAFWSVLVAKAAQASIAAGKPVDVADLIPDSYEGTR